MIQSRLKEMISIFKDIVLGASINNKNSWLSDDLYTVIWVFHLARHFSNFTILTVFISSKIWCLAYNLFWELLYKQQA